VQALGSSALYQFTALFKGKKETLGMGAKLRSVPNKSENTAAQDSAYFSQTRCSEGKDGTLNQRSLYNTLSIQLVLGGICTCGSSTWDMKSYFESRCGSRCSRWGWIVGSEQISCPCRGTPRHSSVCEMMLFCP